MNGTCGQSISRESGIVPDRPGAAAPGRSGPRRRVNRAFSSLGCRSFPRHAPRSKPGLSQGPLPIPAGRSFRGPPMRRSDVDQTTRLPFGVARSERTWFRLPRNWRTRESGGRIPLAKMSEIQEADGPCPGMTPIGQVRTSQKAPTVDGSAPALRGVSCHHRIRTNSPFFPAANRPMTRLRRALRAVKALPPLRRPRSTRTLGTWPEARASASWTGVGAVVLGSLSLVVGLRLLSVAKTIAPAADIGAATQIPVELLAEAGKADPMPDPEPDTGAAAAGEPCVRGKRSG